MAEIKRTILELWPEIKGDFQELLADTDGWIISTLQDAYDKKDWEQVRKLLEVMHLIHNMSHQH